MLDFVYKDRYTLNDVVLLIRKLRSDTGCPWDREQTHKSIKMNFIEETYEACEAIDIEDTELLREELGDVLVQVIFHSEIERENRSFDIDDVADRVCKKFIARHPHVFSDVKVSGSAEVLSNWDDIKRGEKLHATFSDEMAGVSRGLPALMRAEKIHKKAEKAGVGPFDFNLALDKLKDDIEKLRGKNPGDHDLKTRIGEVLFDFTGIARNLGVDAEEALSGETHRFEKRFTYVENAALNSGKTVSGLSRRELDSFFAAAKEDERLNKPSV